MVRKSPFFSWTRGASITPTYESAAFEAIWGFGSSTWIRQD
jgi:hypothetical protein